MIYNSYYRTFPLVLHKPGGNSVSFWDKMVDKLFLSTIDVAIPKELSIVTCNNKIEPSILEKNLDHLSMPYTVLGKGIKNWKNPLKLKLFIEEFKKCKTKYVLGLDAFDVILLGCPSEIVKRFIEMDCKLEEKIGCGHKFPYLNAGVFIGETEFCLNFYEQSYKIGLNSFKNNPWILESEQLFLKNSFEFFHPDVKLDYCCEIFQIAHPMDNNVNLKFSDKLFC
jgi:hypothetical protein